MKTNAKPKDILNGVSSATSSSFSSQLTAAELMRQKLRREESAAKSSDEKETCIDIDEEIKRLEAELAGDSSSSSSHDSSDNDSSLDENDHDREIDNEEQTNAAGFPQTGVICLSECATEKIVPLPKDALPTVKSKKLKIDLNNEDNKTKSREKKRSKKRKERSNSTEHVVNDGLVAAVKDVLSGYVARSSERIPFYCRVCSHQSKSEEDFKEHRESEFHKAAVQVEKKATYCKLCRKQLTSLVQMQEHLASRPHREKMDYMKSRQSGGSAGRGRPNGGRFGVGGRSSFRGTRGSTDVSAGPTKWHGDKRQWC